MNIEISEEKTKNKCTAIGLDRITELKAFTLISERYV